MAALRIAADSIDERGVLRSLDPCSTAACALRLGRLTALGAYVRLRFDFHHRCAWCGHDEIVCIIIR